MKAILLDIEGTTTPISFVHDTLFPYARDRVANFVEKHFGDLKDEINQLSEESATDTTYTIPFDPTEPGSVSTYLRHLIDVDRKSTPLKSIQGKIWREGYESGELLSLVFDDVPPAMQRWRDSGNKIAIFSSGSVEAQRLLFRKTDGGDLTTFIDAYFDTTVGPKSDPKSYERIAAALETPANEIVFFSDVPDELAAASSAGMEAVLVTRPGNRPVPDADGYRVVRSFETILD